MRLRDVVGDLVEPVADREPRGDLGDREPGRLRGQRARARHARVHLDDHDLVGGRVDRELHVRAAGLDARPRGSRRSPGRAAPGTGGRSASAGGRRSRESPVWTPIGSTFSIEQTMTTLSALSRITSSSNSPQPSTDSSISTWPIGDAARPPATIRSKSASVRAIPPPRPPSVNAGRMISGSPKASSAARACARSVAIVLRAVRRPASLHRGVEQLAVLGAADRVVGRADQLDAEALERAVLVQRLGEVERGLAAQRRQQRVRPLALDHLGDRAGQQRLDVGGGRELRVGHDRRRVRVDEDDVVALLEQHLARLGAGVVELGGLADHDRPRAEHEDLLEVVPTRHGRTR